MKSMTRTQEAKEGHASKNVAPNGDRRGPEPTKRLASRFKEGPVCDAVNARRHAYHALHRVFIVHVVYPTLPHNSLHAHPPAPPTKPPFQSNASLEPFDASLFSLTNTKLGFALSSVVVDFHPSTSPTHLLRQCHEAGQQLAHQVGSGNGDGPGSCDVCDEARRRLFQRHNRAQRFEQPPQQWIGFSGEAGCVR